jgi:hypothetical protein
MYWRFVLAFLGDVISQGNVRLAASLSERRIDRAYAVHVLVGGSTLTGMVLL